ncbi:MAG: tRNA dihydrouridine synthase DusB [Firmicutes bacterium]|nr:tRNA dihydrouridine synthase DusB [Bacillota bacterium]
MTYFSEAERPIGLQLFGSEPELLVRAARKAEKLGADLIDLNLGCPTPRIVRNGEGGALLLQPRLCSKIFKAVVRAVSCPVTAKLRAGWDENRINAVEIAGRAEDAGIKALTVHGRTVTQGFAGRADWEIIARVREAVGIPLFGNGDIASAEDAAAMFNRCGCDGIAIGRAALGNPWIFQQVRERLEGREVGAPPTLPERLAVFQRHLELSCNFRGEQGALVEMRQQAGRYLRGFPGAARIRKSIMGATSVKNLQVLIRRLLNCGNIK